MVEDVLPSVIEEEEEEIEKVDNICFCDVPMDNCLICDEVFVNDLSIECEKEDGENATEEYVNSSEEDVNESFDEDEEDKTINSDCNNTAGCDGNKEIPINLETGEESTK